MNDPIRSLVEAFVSDLAALVRAQALESVSVALGSTTPTRGKKTAGVATPRLRAKKGKRTGAEMDRFIEAVLATVAKNPGIGADAVAAGLGVATKDVTLPIKKLLDAKCLSKKGQRRGTKYTAKSGASWRRT